MNTEQKLIKETEKWLKKASSLKVDAKSKKGVEYIKNINAYILDSKHFLIKKKYVEAFEAIVWAWALIEIGKEMKLLD